MPKSKKSITTKFSFDSKERTIALLRALVRSRYFNQDVPSPQELSRLLRVPLTSINVALHHLTASQLLTEKPNNKGYHYSGWPKKAPLGQIAFIINTDILRGWHSLFQEWLTGFEDVMEQENYETILISDFLNPQDKIAKINLLRERGVMGLVLASRTEFTVIQHIVETEIPAVIVGNATTDQEQISAICSNNRYGMNKILRHLFELNHTEIALYTTGTSYHSGFQERHLAYQNGMRRVGLTPMSDLIFTEPHSEFTAQKAAQIYIGMPQKPTAIICGSDREAFELVAAFKHLNIHVPSDVSLVGFDNNHYGKILEPAMTTIDIHAVEMGKIAANYLLTEMQEPQLPIKIQLPTQLIERQSVKALPKTADSITPPPMEDIAPGKILTF